MLTSLGINTHLERRFKCPKHEVHLAVIYIYVYILTLSSFFLKGFDIETIRSININAFKFVVYNTHASALYIKGECILNWEMCVSIINDHFYLYVQVMGGMIPKACFWKRL